MNDPWLENSTHEECFELLRASVGRIAVITDEAPSFSR